MQNPLALPRRAVAAIFCATLLLAASLVACSSDQITGLKAPEAPNAALGVGEKPVLACASVTTGIVGTPLSAGSAAKAGTAGVLP